MLPGERTTWNGFGRFDFEAEAERFLVVEPRREAAGRPWIWRAEFFDHEPQADLALLEAGWRVAHVFTAAGHYGAPVGVAAWDRAYRYLTERHGFSRRLVLEGFSRGGLLAYNWAILHPDKVVAIYADAPVLDIRSWPGGRGEGRGYPEDWRKCLEDYGLTEESAGAFTGGPLDNLAPLARGDVPLLHVVGDADGAVPVSENTAVLEERYRALGGRITVIHKPDCDHHPHSLPDPAPIVDFLLEAWRERGGG